MSAELAPGDAADARSSAAEIDMPLPAPLRRFGGRLRARLSGAAHGPPVVVLGGISGNRFVCGNDDGRSGWWPGLVGPGGAVDPGRHRIIGIDYIADETGAAAPSTEDQAAAVAALLDHVGIGRARAVVGASYGGMVALGLGQHHPGRVERLVVISAGASAHPAATAVRALQRRVVALGLETGGAAEALSIARGLAMLTYRTREEFGRRFAGGLAGPEPLGPSEPDAYLRARGEAFQSVMTPGRFLSLSAAIDRHRVDPAGIGVPALLIGAETDQLVPPAEMEALAAALAGPAALHILPSLYGHDMFLKDAPRLASLVAPWLETDA